MRSPYEIIEAKKRSMELSPQDIAYFIHEYTVGRVNDAQMAAFCMAVTICGMSDEETVALTQAMAESGDMVDTRSIPGLCDKHSTGGVGDKTTFLIAGMLGAIGVPVGMMSGRGLGHTGGTLDKLESIDGWKCSFSANEFMDLVDANGIAIIGQTGELAPADKKMYALRSLTATIDSIPLICASIMSKKIASGSQNLVLDVKYGGGAFIEDKGQSKALAEMMCSIGRAAGMNIGYCQSPVDDVLGKTAGNAVEIAECLNIMSGQIDPLSEKLVELSLDLAELLADMYFPEKAGQNRKALKDSLFNNRAYVAFARFVEGQGGKVDDGKPVMRLPDETIELLSPATGVIQAVDVKGVGMSLARMGANRLFEGEPIHHDVGLVVAAHLGDHVDAGQPLGWICYNKQRSERKISSAADTEKAVLSQCWEIA